LKGVSQWRKPINAFQNLFIVRCKPIMTRIYTKTGDDGQTSLWGGTRVSKGDARVEAYGTLDELNAVLGVLRAAGTKQDELLGQIQQDLFLMGSQVAATDDKQFSFVPIGPRESARLERAIDQADAELPELRNFILPSGSMAGAWCHLARTVCRRAERQLVRLDQQRFQQALIYLNRLSDLLFVLARLINQQAGCSEQIWTPPQADSE
jgi:cob(I)alamin adenosyltransferase